MQTSIFKFNSDSISAASMGADISGTGLDVAEATVIAVHSVWSAGSSPVGFVLIQASNDGTTYTTIDSQAVSGNTGSLMYKASDVGYRYIRAAYSRTSGSGTLTSKISAKG